MRTRHVPFLAVAAVLTACSPFTGGRRQPAVQEAEASITALDVHDRIAYLASDELRGRNTPSEGLDTAAQWIADQLARFGLEPGDHGAWIQRYPYPAYGLDTRETRFEISNGATHTLEYGTDFYAQAGSAPRGAVDITFVGDDIAAAASGLRDRVAVVRLPGLPEQGRRGFGFGRDARRAVYGALDAAAEAGAAGVAFVLDPGVGPADIAALARAAERPARRFGEGDDERPAAFFLSRPAADRLFRMAGLDAATLLEGGPVGTGVPLGGVRVRVGAPARKLDDATAPNVVGILRGSDPELRDTYVVLSAHMDHLGVGTPDASGDSIFNGADDDASGTAVMVEVAEALASLPTPPKRSVLFVAVSGEEKGLLGSRWFSDHPTVPTADMVADLNLDMVARNAADSIVVIGQEYSSLGPQIHRVAAQNPELGLTVAEDLWPEQRFFFRSDHFNFARKDVPALFFFAGTHEDYHRVSDDVEHADVDKAARIGRLVFLLAYDIAQSPDRPRWTPRGLQEVRALTRP